LSWPINVATDTLNSNDIATTPMGALAKELHPAEIRLPGEDKYEV
jgi:hypothetical protein